MRLRSWKLLLPVLLLLLSAGLWLICSERDARDGFVREGIAIRVNQAADELMEKYPKQLEVARHPAGLNFYSMDWPRDALASIVIGQPDHAVTIPYVLGISGTDNTGYPEENISEWHIYAGLTAPELMGHDEARQAFFRLIQSIRDAGWRNAISRGAPRLKGKDTLRYVQAALVGCLDPDYVPDLEEWMKLGAGNSWCFYADHAYFRINLTRDQNRTDIHQPGAYFLTYDLVAENEEMRAYVGPQNRREWKTRLPEALALELADRQQKEAEWQRKGARIDRAYQDPPVPAIAP